MHCNLTADFKETLRIAGRLNADQDTDFAEVRRRAVVHVAGDHALAYRQLSAAAQVHVLADGRDGVGDRGCNGLTSFQLCVGKRLDRLGFVNSDGGDIGHQLLELVVAGDKVCFSI